MKFCMQSMIVAAALLLGLSGLSAFFFIAGRDIDPPDVSDVLPPPAPPITEAENMAPVLMAATNQLVLTKDDRYFANVCYRKAGWDRRLRNIGDGSRVLAALRARNVLPTWRSRLENPAIPTSLFEWPDSLSAPKWFSVLANGIGRGILSFPGYRRYLFQPNRTIGELADVVWEMESYAYSIPYTAEARARCHAVQTAHLTETRWTRRNGCGTSEVMNGLSIWSIGRSLGINAFSAEASRVVLAAARYKRTHGCYPPTLDALVPEFLSEVPRDPFDASRPLGYNAEQGTLHTVGAEGAFSGRVRDSRFPYGGLTTPNCRYIRRIDGRPMELPLKTRKGTDRR